jgi:hypothetical protein
MQIMPPNERQRRDLSFGVINSFGVIEVKGTAGSDALAVVKAILEGCLEELRAYEGLSKTTDGFF